MPEPGIPIQRRQPPSPLVFSPETIMSPPNITSSHASGSGMNSNTVSMPFVRRHVTRRLKVAKSECDKELSRITNNITTFFEERLRDALETPESEREFLAQQRERIAEYGAEARRNGTDLHPDAYNFGIYDQSALQTDESSSDGGYEAEPEHNRHGRQRALPDAPSAPSLTHRASSSGLAVASSESSLSPSSLRRQHTAPWDKPLNSSPSSLSSSIVLPDAPLSRKRTDGGSTAGRPNQTLPSRRLSRSIHIPVRTSRSGQSSRSTSRSRSPLPPPNSHASFSDTYSHAPPPISSSNRRSSRILLDDPVDPIMTALYDIIGLASDIQEMTLAQLTSQPKICETLVERVQNIGRAWDENPGWHGRNWYVQVLLAVAGLSRVVEWWEAEKQFWNFDDNEEEQDEPLVFVTKHDDETFPMPPADGGAGTSTSPGDDDKLKVARPLNQGRKSRDEHPKQLSTSLTSSKEPPDTISRARNAESARVLATERLRLQAETAQNQNIVVELSLDGDHVIWANYAWGVVVGTDAEEMSGTRISQLLHPGDWDVFLKANELLRRDDSKTVDVKFKLVVAPENDNDIPPGGNLYQKMEGQGMLMIDRDDGMPSHTMWVVKPVGPPRFEYDTPEDMTPDEDTQPTEESVPDEPSSALPFSQPISIAPILCRICECPVPSWYFEKHSETCVEQHRLEAEIAECNESISELRNTIRNLATIMDTPSSSPGALEYRGMPIYVSTPSPSSSPLQLFTKFNKMHRFNVKKMQRRLLDQLEDILQVAFEVSIPSLKEDESKEPIERQRLLSPGSERKMTQIRNWNQPSVEDAALRQLVQDAERIMRQKIDSVVRMQNTIRYSEKVWCEWREKVEEILDLGGDSGSDSDTDSRGPETSDSRPRSELQRADDDHSSTTSEYAFNGEASAPSSDPTPDPTPAAPSPAPYHPYENRSTASVTLNSRPYNTRSSTPSSVSSPLAYAAPIVASSSPEDMPPPMSLDDDSSFGIRRSLNMPEPKVYVTPPISPMLSAKDIATVTRENSISRRHHRRYSAVTSSGTGSIPGSNPLSPRQPSAAPISRSTPTSINNFEIIKPISKGAFGSVFLAKKKVTGDYYAIKVLKKADMISKNQITNVKAERTILMNQSESPFVAKLYFTFQSKDNLYLVMEYLNGGDCAALIKSLGSLPEEWTKNYIAEVILGLESLHEKGIVHRDLKPDNLLIDSHGHLKLTDFGLSRIGLLGRQSQEDPLSRYARFRSRPPSMDSAFLSSPLLPGDGGSYFNQRTHPAPRNGNSPYITSTDDVDSSGSDSVHGLYHRWGSKATDSPLQSFATELTNDLRSHNVNNNNSSNSNNPSGGTPPGEPKFVGTPDYLAPETILGLRGDDASVDWWALGVITYEFLYGIPPFHGETPEKVFENILSGQVEWHEDWVEFSPEARDFMERLMTISVPRRLGANGAAEVKAHPWFRDIDWDKVTTTEAAFIPQVTDPESTDYFDPRGAIPQLFHDDDDAVAIMNQALDSPSTESNVSPPVNSPQPIPLTGQKEHTSNTSDDFGSFSFKNIPILKQANDDVIRKLKTDQMVPLTHTLSEPMGSHTRKRSLSQRLKKPPSVITAVDGKSMVTGPPSPATSTSSVASSPSRGSLPPSTPGSGPSHSRKASELGAVERFRINHLEGVDRRNSMPSRLRTASVSSAGDGSGSEAWNSSAGQGSNCHETPPSSVHSIDLRKGPDPSDRVVTCLLAEDNPITAKIIETLLIRLGCRCVVVADGSEAISVAMGDIKFDCILMDLQMPVLDGEGAARYIKNTTGKNCNTPIISVSAYSGSDHAEESGNIFAASLSKPLQKADLLAVMRQLGFKTSPVQGPGAPRLTTSRIAS